LALFIKEFIAALTLEQQLPPSLALLSRKGVHDEQATIHAS
jgi:hypothetical protein